MKKKLWFLVGAVAALWSVTPLQAQEKEQLSAKIVVGPYLQAVTEDGFTVVWTTDMDAVAWVEVAPNDNSHFFAEDRPKYYQSEAGKRPIGKLHAVRVEGLEKGTTYRYRVMQQSVISPEGDKRLLFGIPSGNDPFRQKPYTVTTLDRDKESMDFAVINDIHGKDSIFRALMKDVVADKLDMVFFNGDMLSSMDSEEQLYDGYLRSAAELFGAYIPFFNLRGNHESRGLFSYRHLDYFPTTSGETYYLIRQGPAAILMLDCGEDKPDNDISYFGLMLSDSYREKEAEWLKKTVQSEEFQSAPVKIAVLHMPPGPTGWHGIREINRLFVPILNEAGIDLMLSGHIHRYSFSEGADRGCNFPVLTNGASEKHYFHVTREGITGKRIDAAGKVLQEYDFRRK